MLRDTSVSYKELMLHTMRSSHSIIPFKYSRCITTRKAPKQRMKGSTKEVISQATVPSTALSKVTHLLKQSKTPHEQFNPGAVYTNTLERTISECWLSFRTVPFCSSCCRDIVQQEWALLEAYGFVQELYLYIPWMQLLKVDGGTSNRNTI